MHPGSSERAAAYRVAAARHLAERDRHARRSRTVAYSRIVTFVAGVTCLLLALPAGAPVARLLLAAGVCLVVFLALVYAHSRVDARERWESAVGQLNEEAAARVMREWDRLPPVSCPPVAPSHPYAEDLDVCGHASLVQLLGWVGTEVGRRTLRDWLTTPATPEVIEQRQEAVRELAGLAAFREGLAALGRLVEPGGVHLDAFVEWAGGGSWMHERRWLLWSTRLLRVAIVALAAAELAGFTSRPLWLYPAVAGLALSWTFGRRIHQTLTRVFSRQPLFQQYAAMFALAGSVPASSPLLAGLQAGLRRSGTTAAVEMARLDRLKRLADLRFQALFHFPIDAFLLWDFFVIDSLEQWQHRVGGCLRAWFEILGELDTLSAIGALSHDNPEWAFPEVRPEADRLTARALGHPLLPDVQRVANDVEVGPPGSVLLVTGSNMSGKSTLLRSIGINVVLAQAGAPVCAERLVMPPLRVYTSMRLQDSLEAGVSYFMAALRRLKLVVDAARSSPPGPPRLLYLLDEVLQGTNTAERQVAVRRILDHLLALPVIGAVTTHDLELAASAELRATCRAVHFTEGVEEGPDGARLSFDYRLRPGVATSRNALKLLRLVGLDS